MPNYKNQHYLQQAYLRGFAVTNVPEKWGNDSAIWVLSKDSGHIRLKSIKNIAKRSHYYSFKDKNGKMNPLIEKWFNQIEKEFIKMRQHIRDHITEWNLTNRASNLDPKYRRILAGYTHINMIRVPSVFDNIKEQAINFEKEMSSKYGEAYDENPAQVLALRTLIRLGQSQEMNIVDALMKRTLDVESFLRTKVSLATSDIPVMMYDESRSEGLAHESTTIFFPLDSNIMLRFAEFGNQVKLIRQLDLTKVTPLHKLIGIKAQNEIYCRDQAVLLQIADYLGLEGKVHKPL